MLKESAKWKRNFSSGENGAGLRAPERQQSGLVGAGKGIDPCGALRSTL
jgi:hypothetical protein